MKKTLKLILAIAILLLITLGISSVSGNQNTKNYKLNLKACIEDYKKLFNAYEKAIAENIQLKKDKIELKKLLLSDKKKYQKSLKEQKKLIKKDYHFNIYSLIGGSPTWFGIGFQYRPIWRINLLTQIHLDTELDFNFGFGFGIMF